MCSRYSALRNWSGPLRHVISEIPFYLFFENVNSEVQVGSWEKTNMALIYLPLSQSLFNLKFAKNWATRSFCVSMSVEN